MYQTQQRYKGLHTLQPLPNQYFVLVLIQNSQHFQVEAKTV
jgi:hypothetical protein